MIGVRWVAADPHPDPDTIAAFRRANRAAIERAFPQVLLARERGPLRRGSVPRDGTKPTRMMPLCPTSPTPSRDEEPLGRAGRAQDCSRMKTQPLSCHQWLKRRPLSQLRQP
jgi:hypothetical protein